ncbi:MAG: hypothetical protein WC868_02600 [Bacteroidales bacterium]
MKALIILIGALIMNMLSSNSQNNSDLKIKEMYDNLYPKETSASIIQNTPYIKDTLQNIRIPKNSFYIELLGNSLYYSLNYERIIFNTNRFYFSGRIGACYLPVKIDDKRFVFPLLINGILHYNKRLHFEFGIGVTFFSLREFNYNYYPSSPNYVFYENMLAIVANIGLRYQGQKGFLFRLGFTPLYSIKGPRLLPWGGISFGYSFLK